MSDTLTPADRQRLRDLARKASPLPWALGPLRHDDWGCIRDATGKPVASTCTQAVISAGGPEQVAINGEYIVAAVNALPKLLDEIERLRDALCVVVGSLRVAAEKEDDAPMSAAAHREEALRVAEMVAAHHVGDSYTDSQGNLRMEARG